MGKTPEPPDYGLMGDRVDKKPSEHFTKLTRRPMEQALKPFDGAFLKHRVLGMFQRRVKKSGFQRMDLSVEKITDRSFRNSHGLPIKGE
jgi:hypothetical protein